MIWSSRNSRSCGNDSGRGPLLERVANVWGSEPVAVIRSRSIPGGDLILQESLRLLVGHAFELGQQPRRLLVVDVAHHADDFGGEAGDGGIREQTMQWQVHGEVA